MYQSKRTDNRCQHAFTLIELLVVIGLISILTALLMPALMRVREQSLRVDCASNLRQWGAAVMAYRASNDGAFPFCDAPHLSWVGRNFQATMRPYLANENQFGASGSAASDPMHMQYCPTQSGYREIMLTGWTPPDQLELIGYFYLPGRLPTSEQIVRYGYFPPMYYTHEEWATQRRLGSKWSNAPIMSDIAEKMEPQVGGWFGIGTGPRSAHANRSTGIPMGMNFLFEDGHVDWRGFDGVGVGATVPTNSLCYFDIPIN